MTPAAYRFNRFYTRRIGIVREGLLDSSFSLAEVRVMYELAHHENLTAEALADALEIDGGYLSRLLGKFERQGLLARVTSTSDRRQRLLALTAAGRRAFAPLDQRTLHAARKLYKRAGFRRPGSERHHSFGKSLVAETWELQLAR